MKSYFVILAVCLVSVNADPVVQQSVANYKNLINDLVKEMVTLAKDAGVALKKQFEHIVYEPLHQVETKIVNIFKLREQNEECFADQDAKIKSTIIVMHQNMTACAATAVKTSAAIVTDISAATQQLLFGGYDLVQLKKKCNSYTQTWLKDTCLARWSVKASLYLKDARRSVKIIKKSTDERVPAVAAAADYCTHKTAEETSLALDNISDTITECIAESETVLNVL